MSFGDVYFYMSRITWITVILLIGSLVLYVLNDFEVLERYTRKGGRFVCMYGLIFYFVNLIYCAIRVITYYI